MVNKFNKEALLTIVAEWIEEAEIPPLITRQGYSVELEKLTRVLAIVGARRAGKTYFMYQLIDFLLKTGRYMKKDILFIDFEDYRLSNFTTDNIDDLFTAFHQITGQYPLFLLFDEIQHLPDWNRVLRTLHNRRRFKIVVSGSNSKLLEQETAAELRGRYENILMLPFSFHEYLDSRNILFSTASLHTASRGDITAAFTEYIKHGGFPEVVVARNSNERRRILQSYFRTVFYRDLLDRYHIKARYILDALMNDVLENYADLFSISRFERQLKANNLPVSKRTISNYLHYLREAFFIIAIEKFSFSPRKRLMNPKKIYLMDTGFDILGKPFSENRGKVLENVVAIELFRRGIEFYYFKGRHECDFVIKQGSRAVQAIQVCWELSSHNEKRELAGLVETCDLLDLSSAVIFTNSQEEERELNGRRIHVCPVWKWLLGVDNTGLA
jgi:uncharacterized protein